MVNPDELDQVLRGADDGTDAALTDVLARVQHVARGETVTPTAALDALLQAPPGGAYWPEPRLVSPRPTARRLAISASTVRLTLGAAVAAAAVAASVLVGQSLSRTPTTPVDVITPASTSSPDTSTPPAQVSSRTTKAPAAPLSRPTATTRRPLSVTPPTGGSQPRATDDTSTSTRSSDAAEQTTPGSAPEPSESTSPESSESSTDDGGSSSAESTSEQATTPDSVESVDPVGDGSDGAR